MRYAVIENHNGDYWMLGIYESYLEAIGAVYDAALVELGQLEECEFMQTQAFIDPFAGYYIELWFTYPETEENGEITVKFRIYRERKDSYKRADWSVRHE